jgi:hypothetical protein
MGDAVKCADNLTARKIAAEAYRQALDVGWSGLLVTKEQARTELRRFDLACWCPLPEPGETDWCHARVLLEIANA